MVLLSKKDTLFKDMNDKIESEHSQSTRRDTNENNDY